jgi:N-acetylmuramic acid 6-phosphate etherase
LKAGTAQKLILNMITTSTMIQLGHVKGNKMVDMQLTNDKLTGRAERMVMDELQVSLTVAQDLLKQHHNVRAAISAYQKT